jgi:hypothetical protein
MTSTRKNKPCARIIGAALCLAILSGTFCNGAGIVITRAPKSYASQLPGTLGYAMVTNLDSRLAGINATNLCPITNPAQHPTNWTWNTASPWAGMRGVSGIAWRREISTNDATTYGFTGALVASNVLLTCHHAGASPGSVFWFLGTNGTPERRIALAYANLDGTYQVNDAQVVLLSGACTNTEPMRVLPADAQNYLSIGFPALAQSAQGNDFRRLYVHSVSQFGAGIYLSASTNYPTLTRPYAIGGDSGCPILFCIGNELVFASTWYTSVGANWNTSGSNYAALETAISNLCVAAGLAVQTLTPASLTNYTHL